MTADFEYAVLVAIDLTKRSLLDELSLRTGRTPLRDVFRRPPDFEDASVISWSSVTLDEAQQLARLDDVPEDQAQVLLDLEQLYAKFPSASYSLYHCDPYREQ